MNDVDWNEQATWARAAEHAVGIDDPTVEPAEDRGGRLVNLINEYFSLTDEHRLAVTITRANGLPLDDFELRELARRPDFPTRKREDH